MEVSKTRMQLQGELAKDGGVKVYNNALDAIKKTWKNEGIRGVQRGLPPAVSHLLPLRLVAFTNEIF
jgi:solute carrier family 25, member 34/35